MATRGVPITDGPSREHLMLSLFYGSVRDPILTKRIEVTFWLQEGLRLTGEIDGAERSDHRMNSTWKLKVHGALVYEGNRFYKEGRFRLHFSSDRRSGTLWLEE